MGEKKYWIIRLFFVLFTISVSVAILPCGIINVHGLFGDVVDSAVVEDREQEIVNINDVEHEKAQTEKGINIFNIWFEILKLLFKIDAESPTVELLENEEQKETLEITQFYTAKGMTPILYQSISDDGYFEEIKQELLKNGFDSWMETQNYMVLSEKNVIVPNQEIVVQKVSTWKDEYAVEIFEKAEEPWEIAVAKQMIENRNTLFFVASYQGKPVGMLYGHVKEDVCRGDYMLVSKEARNIGVGRALMNSFVTYCNENQIKNCFLWPDGETAERIYYEAGFRYVETKKAGRAVYRRDSRKVRSMR